jgi:DNA-binding MarR family transcriptional regulator
MSHEQLTCRQAAILMLVRANPGCTVGAIAHTLGAHKPTVTRAADKLENYLLIHRKPDPQDRRLVQLWPGRGPRKASR